MTRPTYQEVIALATETQAAAVAYHEMNKLSLTTPFGPKEGIELEKLAVKASNLNKKKKEVFALFTPEEMNEIRNLAQSK